MEAWLEVFFKRSILLHINGKWQTLQKAKNLMNI